MADVFVLLILTLKRSHYLTFNAAETCIDFHFTAINSTPAFHEYYVGGFNFAVLAVSY